ncbi:MAG: hypothetical protein EXR71_01470 [Myxococcales bacterium]|nr:hypothetical protein [Myxococcales bacterium]
MILSFVLACSPPQRAEGVLTDALRGTPIVGATVRAEAADPACLRASSVTDSAGRFLVDAPCAGSTFSPVDDRWALTAAVVLDGSSPLQLDGWPAPAADGLYRLRGDELLTLTTNTPLASLHLPGGDLRYPLVLPGEAEDIQAGDYIVIAGAGLAGWGATRLFPSPELRVDGPAGPATFGAWSVVGAEFGDDGSIALTPAVMVGRDVSLLDSRPIRYLSLGAQLPGRWILTERDASRGVVIDLVDG